MQRHHQKIFFVFYALCLCSIKAKADSILSLGVSAGPMTYYAESDNATDKQGTFGRATLGLRFGDLTNRIILEGGVASGFLKGSNEALAEETVFNALLGSVSYGRFFTGTPLFAGVFIDSFSGRGTSPQYHRRDDYTSQFSFGLHGGIEFSWHKRTVGIICSYSVPTALNDNLSLWTVGANVALATVKPKAMLAAAAKTARDITQAGRDRLKKKPKPKPKVVTKKPAPEVKPVSLAQPAPTPPIEIGIHAVRFSVAHFSYASSVLTLADRLRIETVTKALLANRTLWHEIEIIGFASAGGVRNDSHAELRANAVRAAFIEFGIPEPQILKSSFGDTRLIHHKNPEGPEQRRTEVLLSGVTDIAKIRSVLPADLEVIVE